jgi:hypothetical protein
MLLAAAAEPVARGDARVRMTIWAMSSKTIRDMTMMDRSPLMWRFS